MDFKAEDLRKKEKLPVKGHIITASGYEVNELNIKEMLTTMGVNPDDATVQEAMGFFSKNGMEINMTNLHEFIKTKGFFQNCTDLRRAATAKKN